MRQRRVQLGVVAAMALAVCATAVVRTQLAAVAADATSVGQVVDPPDLDPVDEPAVLLAVAPAVVLPVTTHLAAAPVLRGRRATPEIFRPPAC